MIWFSTIQEFLSLAKELDKLAGTLELDLVQKNYLDGYCDKCRAVTALHNTAQTDHWTDRRGQFKCATCGFVSRLRSFWKTIQDHAGTSPCSGARMLLAEGVTPFAAAARKQYPGIVCSEYLETVPMGTTVELENAAVTCQDLMNLTFGNGELDFIFHQEVLEHVPDADAALREMCRVLKSGGMTIFTAPFFHLRPRSEVRARIINGELIHIKSPAYHGNPLSPDGSLVFENFGADFFERSKKCGFAKSEIGIDYDVARCVLSNGNPYDIGRMLPVTFRLQK